MMESINIFYASDDNYAKPLAVSMVSIMENTSSPVKFFILENNISESAKNNLKKIQEKYNCSIKFLNVKIDEFKNFPDLNWYSLNMYSRFLIPILEPTISKAIYLDVDIILQKDIKELYEINIDKYTIAAVIGEKSIINTDTFKKHIKNLGLSNNHTYFGSGVLVINCNKWIEENITQKLYKIIENKKEQLKYPDQDVLNIMFDNDYYKLSTEWNRDIACLQDDYEDDPNAVEKCFLLHYDGKEKPWNNRNVFAACLWEKYHNILFAESELPAQNKETNKFFLIVKNPIIFLKYLFYKLVYNKKNKHKKYKRKLGLLKNYRLK